MKLTKQNNLAVKNKKLAKEWHPIKNGDLTPCNVTPASGRKVWWKCVECDYEWDSSILNRNAGTGCPVCAGQVITKFNCLAVKKQKIS